MKYASIVPVANIERTFSGDYAMMLAHLAPCYFPHTASKQCYRILDNSLIELGSAMPIGELCRIAKMCRASEIVLPDVFREGVATYKNAVQLVHMLKLVYQNRIPFNLMAVCQGKTIEEFTKCFNNLERIPEIHCIGIPKVASELLPGIGRSGLEFVWEHSSKQIHLLGIAESFRELEQYKHPEKIRSVDSCLAALLSKSSNSIYGERPTQTIDLQRDSINVQNYLDILQQLKERGWL